MKRFFLLILILFNFTKNKKVREVQFARISNIPNNFICLAKAKEDLNLIKDEKKKEDLNKFLNKIEKHIEETPKTKKENIVIDPEIKKMRLKIEENSDFIRYTHNKLYERVRKHFVKVLDAENQRKNNFKVDLEKALKDFYE